MIGRDLGRRAAAVLVALGLAALVACDLCIDGFRGWWDRHSLTGSIVSNLLVLAVAGLIVDEVVARRQRRDRAVSVAVEGLIVFGQARRAYAAITAGVGEDPRSGAALEELRTLGSMVLTASPSLFDDPDARRFLGQVERLSVSMVHTISASSGPVLSAASQKRLEAEMAQLTATVQPLLLRIPQQDRALLEGSPEE